MSVILKLCGCAIATVVITLLLKKLGSPLSVTLSVASGIVILLSCVSGLGDAVGYLGELSEKAGMTEYLPYVMKCTAVVIFTDICADVCDEAGEKFISKSVTAAGRVELVAICLPLIRSVTDAAMGMLGR